MFEDNFLGVVFGKGFLGSIIAKGLGYDLVGREADPLNLDLLKEFLNKKNPDVVICAIGKTGRPNIDWCELNKEETILSNISAVINLSIECAKRDIYFVYLGSGCIYNGNNSGKGFSEHDEPNFNGSFYSKTKIMAEKILKEFPGLILRIRMPVSDYPHERNLIDKLRGYKKIINIKNSITTVPSMVDALKVLIKKRRQGIYNLVNPGVISASEIMGMYGEIVDFKHEFEIFSLEELERVTMAERSNCVLNNKKILSEGIELPSIQESVRSCLVNYRKHI